MLQQESCSDIFISFSVAALCWHMVAESELARLWWTVYPFSENYGFFILRTHPSEVNTQQGRNSESKWKYAELTVVFTGSQLNVFIPKKLTSPSHLGMRDYIYIARYVFMSGTTKSLNQMNYTYQ